MLNRLYSAVRRRLKLILTRTDTSGMDLRWRLVSFAAVLLGIVLAALTVAGVGRSASAAHSSSDAAASNITTTSTSPCDINSAADYSMMCPIGSPAERAQNAEDCATYQSWMRECEADSYSVDCDFVIPGRNGYLPNPCGDPDIP